MTERAFWLVYAITKWLTVLITSNLPFSKWEAIFKDPMTTAAAIDRLIHHSVFLGLNVSIRRAEEAKKRKTSGPTTSESPRGLIHLYSFTRGRLLSRIDGKNNCRQRGFLIDAGQWSHFRLTSTRGPKEGLAAYSLPQDTRVAGGRQVDVSPYPTRRTAFFGWTT